MDWIRRLAQRKNRVFLLLAVAELIFLGWRFAGDYRVPEPVILGAAGLVLCLVAGLPLSLTVILLFWAVYGVLALCGWGISRLLLGLWHLIMGK